MLALGSLALSGALLTNSPDPAESPARPDAFDIPTAARTNPYGQRPEGVPKLRLEQLLRMTLDNPAVAAAGARVEAMTALFDRARFLWAPTIVASIRLSPGANVVCDDVELATSDGGTQPFQWCRPSNGQDISTIRGYLDQLGEAGVHFGVRADAVFPLVTFGKIRATKAAARAGVDLRRYQRMQVEHESVLRVHQAHAGLLLARESLQILREARSVADAALERVRKDLGVGADGEAFFDPDAEESDRDPNDLHEVELAQLELQQRMWEARRVEAVSLAALWALAGRAAPEGFDIEEERLARREPRGGLDPLAEYRERARKERPEAKMAAAAVQVRGAQAKLARANFLPDLGLVVGAGFGRSSAADAEMREIYYQDGFNYDRLTAALALRWKLDFYNANFELRRSRAELRAADYQREAADLLLGHEVDRAYQALVAAGHRVQLAADGVKAAWKLVVANQARDMVGGGDAKELVKSLQRWYEWRFRELEATMEHNVALADLARAVGAPLD